MGLFQNHMMAAAAAATADTAYSIDNSCMFDFASSSYLTRTPGAAGNRRTWTMSVWLKQTRLPSTTSGGLAFFNAGAEEFFWHDSNDQLYIVTEPSTVHRLTSGVFRDGGGWYHLFLASDTTNATASNRLKFYINGVVPSLSTSANPSENFDWDINNTVAHNIGKRAGDYWDGYMADFILVDGEQKEHTDFGKVNDEGVWVPIDYTGSYGTNGFHLDFASSGDLGNDVSGNNNDFTVSGIGSDHQVTDTPTTNYPILNFNDAHTESSAVLSEGCRKFLNTNTAKSNDVRATFGVSSGKWYWETKITDLGQSGVNREILGVVSPSWEIDSGSDGTAFPFVSGNNGYAYAASGSKVYNDSATSYGTAFSVNDIIGCALDLDNGKIWWSLNGTYQASGDPAAGSNEAFSSLSGMFQPAFSVDYGTGNSGILVNFGQQSFNTAAPTGFKALNSANLEPTISDPSAHFQVATYSGNSSTQTITFDGASDMQPDFVWAKSRSNSDAHVIQEAATGTGTAHFLTRTNSDAVTDAVTAFNSDGFALGDGSELSDGTINTSGRSYVSMNWKGNGSGSSNTTGTINTTKTSANTTAGISINTYTGNGTDQATYGHGLGVTPLFCWTLSLTSADHRTSSTWIFGDTAFSKQVGLDAVGDAFGASNAGLGKVEGGSSTVITLGQDPAVNGSSITYMSLVFAEIEGFSRFSSYTGNGSSDGPFVYCGFSPEFVITKANRGGEPWTMWDRKRSTFNPADDYLMPTNSDAEASSSSISIDFLCNGFKVRGSDSRLNRNDHDIIFAAFAKHPLGGENLGPALAVV